MNFNDSRELLWLVSGLYSFAFFLGLLKTFKLDWPPLRNLSFVLTIIGFAFHTHALYLRGLEVHGCPLGNTLERIQFILWSLILAFLIVRLLCRLDMLGTFCSGLASLGGSLVLTLPDCDPNYWLTVNYTKLFSNPWIELHASVAIFSYGLFSLLSVVSVMYLIQRKALLSRKFDKLGSFLPPIQDLEIAAMRLLSIGILFLTFSILVGGIHWANQENFNLSGKLVVTLFLWIAYSVVFLLHYRQRLYGSKFAKTTIVLFFITFASLSLVSNRSQNTNKPLIPEENNPVNHQ